MQLDMRIQTFDKRLSEILELQHTVQQGIDVINNAHKLGINNVGIDLMYNIPEQTNEQLKQDILMANKLGVEHITLFAMNLSPKTKIAKEIQDGSIPNIGELDREIELYCVAEELLIFLGYIQYSVYDFALPIDYASELCKAMIEAQVDVTWMGYVNALGITETLAKLMYQAGCHKVHFGTDHLDNQMLRNLKKAYTYEDILKANENFKKLGIVCVHSILFGSFGETNRSIELCLERLKELNPDILFISSGIRIYKNTPIYNQLKEAKELDEKTDYLFPSFYTSNKVDADLARRQIDDFISCNCEKKNIKKIVNHF